MEVDYQVLFNMVFGVLGAITGWLLNNTWNAITHLQKQHTELNDRMTEKISDTNRTVAGEYVTRSEFNAVMSRLFDKLDKLTDALHDISLHNHISAQQREIKTHE